MLPGSSEGFGVVVRVDSKTCLCPRFEMLMVNGEGLPGMVVGRLWSPSHVNISLNSVLGLPRRAGTCTGTCTGGTGTGTVPGTLEYCDSIVPVPVRTSVVSCETSDLSCSLFHVY